LLAGVLLILGQPKPFETSPPDTITVDLVTPKEVASVAKEQPAEPAKAAAPQPEPEQQTEPEAPTPGPSTTTSQAASASDETSPQPAAMAPMQQMAVPSAELLAFYNMRPPGSEFDAPADAKVHLTSDEVAQFKARLRQCWRMPQRAAPDTRIVLRIVLSPDGSLAGEPMLIEASAASDGPRVMQAAMQAVEECQPFAFLPRERYEQWREIDVSFSPREMGG
jgi:hypothetical protein